MISVLIVNYFSHALTARAVASVLADDPSAQVIVVDNSADAGECQALRASLPCQAELLPAPENLGFGRGCNLGYAHANGEMILLLNPDAYVVPGCLGRLADTLRSQHTLGAVAPLALWDEAGSFLLPPGQMQTPTREWLLMLGLRLPPLGRWLSRRFRRWALACLGAACPVPQQMLSGGHVLLRRAAIDAAGGLFDPGYFMYYEDADLCRRLRNAGFGLWLDPRAKVGHEWRCDPGKAGFAADSRHYYLHKHFPGSWLADRRRLCLERLWRPAPAAVLDLGVCASPPLFDLPTGESGDWLLELSPHPLFIPSAYSNSREPPCRIPPHIWRLLGAGRYWARVATPGGQELCFGWEVPSPA